MIGREDFGFCHLFVLHRHRFSFQAELTHVTQSDQSLHRWEV